MAAITTYSDFGAPNDDVDGSGLSLACLLIKVKVLVAQSYLILSDPMDCGLPGSSVYGILQARILEWIAIPFPRGSS